MAALATPPGTISMQCCPSCGNMRMLGQVIFRRNTGMIIARQRHTLNSHLCKTCMGKHFWAFQGKNLLFGPWGMISLFMTPIYLVGNTYNYLAARRKLRDVPE